MHNPKFPNIRMVLLPTVYYDFGNDEDQEWLIKEILAHKWANNDLELQVKWTVGDITWELLSSCKDLEALDIYLELICKLFHICSNSRSESRVELRLEGGAEF